MLLIHVRKLHRITDTEGTGIRLFQIHDQTEEGCLTSTVRTDDAHDTVRGEHEVQIREERFLAIGLRYMLCFDDLVTESRTVRNEDLQLLFLLFLLLVEHHLVGVQTGLTLGMTGLGSHAHPFQLAFQRLAALGGRLLLLCQAL